jgi:hypothetical protein
MGSEELAGIARDSCPFCGERVRVRPWELLPTTQKVVVTCSACGEKSQISGRTRIGGGVIGILGSIVTAALTFHSLGRGSTVATVLAYALFGVLGSRLLLRLDPPGLAD